MFRAEDLHRDVTRVLGAQGDVSLPLGARDVSQAELVVSGVFSMFKRIAPLFEPLSSAALLEAQAPSRSRKEDQGLSDPSDPSRRRRTTGTPG